MVRKMDWQLLNFTYIQKSILFRLFLCKMIDKFTDDLTIVMVLELLSSRL